MTRLTLKTGPAWPSEPGLAEQLSRWIEGSPYVLTDAGRYQRIDRRGSHELRAEADERLVAELKESLEG